MTKTQYPRDETEIKVYRNDIALGRYRPNSRPCLERITSLDDCSYFNK